MPRTFVRRDAVLVVVSVLVAVLIAVPVSVWWTNNSSNSAPAIVTTQEPEVGEPSEATREFGGTGMWDPALFAPPVSLEETIEQTEDSLVEVWCGDDYSGTGWVIETDREPVIRASQEIDDADIMDALVVTAWHVVEDCTTGDQEMVVYRGQSTIPAILLNWQKKHDIAVLSAQLTRPGLKVDIETPPGIWTMTSGYPLDDNPTPVFGTVIAKDELQIYTQMPIRPGHSGSPLVNSLGKAIGIVTSVPLDEESGEPYGWTISTSVVALCEKLFTCPAGDIQGFGND